MTGSVGPRYTIIVPTRNGIRYLPYTVDSVLSQSRDDFELIVSDNHSSDGTADYLAGLSDPRVVKLRPDDELPMTAHFEFALSHARGEWVTIVGDDDAVMPFFFEHLDALELETIGVDAIGFRRAYYFWEGCQELYGEAVVSYEPSRRSSVANNNWALFLAVCSITSYQDLPQLYTTGVVRKDFIDRIKERSGGRFFHGAAPDVASAVILAINAPAHFRSGQPIFWTGTSPKSVGYSLGSQVSKSRSKEYEQQNARHRTDSDKRLPERLYEKMDFSVLLYDAVLRCPGAPRFWSSAIMRYFFIAGLVLRGGEGGKAALEAYGSPMLRVGIVPFVVALAVVKRLRKALTRRTEKSSRKFRLKSTDRSAFPTIAHASRHVQRRPD
ncbi:MAG: glycosyltransferase family 2 protein [Alphaproteobacteria bacterium]|nr:glycosyltransferase family 2 protein [Alphaproteobacteria bacterium]